MARSLLRSNSLQLLEWRPYEGRSGRSLGPHLGQSGVCVPASACAVFDCQRGRGLRCTNSCRVAKTVGVPPQIGDWRGGNKHADVRALRAVLAGIVTRD